jgi:hypothetical protein
MRRRPVQNPYNPYPPPRTPGRPRRRPPPAEDDFDDGGLESSGGGEGPLPARLPLAEDVARHPEAPLVVGRPTRDGVVLTCPYCGWPHHHGGYGHRLNHCDGGRGPNGARGYIIIPPPG